MIGAAAIDFFFHALLNKRAAHTNKQLRLCLWQSRESDSINICAVHAKEHSFPPSPSRGNALWRPLLGHSCLGALCSLVFFTGGSLGPTTCSSTTPSRVCV